MARFIPLLLTIALGLNSTAQAENAPDQSETLWLDVTMENMVTPIKQWLDNDPESNESNTQRHQAYNLRSAIKLALLQHQGTVLSANDQSDHYAIKILSKSGIIKIIKVGINDSSSNPPILTPSDISINPNPVLKGVNQ